MTENMLKFQPMPKRFMVWDKQTKTFCQSLKNDDGVFDLVELSVFFMRHAETGRPHTDFEVIQSTNIFDKDGKEIFEGSIVRRVWEAANDGESAPLFLVVWSPVRAEFTFKYGIFYNGVEQIIDKKAFMDVVTIGHVLLDLELLEEE